MTTKLTIDGSKHIVRNWKYEVYTRIIERSKTNRYLDYYEKHHILPRCMGGTDEVYNISILTPREHYICHLLLTGFVKGDMRYKLIAALHYMQNRKAVTRYSSKLYDIFRRKFVGEVSVFMKDLWKNTEYRSKMSKSRSDVWNRQERRDKHDAWLRGNSGFRKDKSHAKTTESRTRNGTNVFVNNNPAKNPTIMSKAVIKRSGERHWSKNRVKLTAVYSSGDEVEIVKQHKFREHNGISRYVWSKMLSGEVNENADFVIRIDEYVEKPQKIRKRPTIECFKCGKIGATNLMKRYHMENCKHENKENN